LELGKERSEDTRSNSLYPGPSRASVKDADHAKAGPVIRPINPPGRKICEPGRGARR